MLFKWPLAILSLGAWINHCQTHEIPMIPAVEIESVPVKDLIDSLDYQLVPSVKRLFDAYARCQKPDHIVRWDNCAPYDLKHLMSRGHTQWTPKHSLITLDDPRFCELIFEYPGETMTLWQRPWITGHISDHYPIEFRVFVENHRIQGLSNYYVQRPLHDTDQIRSFIQQAITYTERCLSIAPAFTMDYLAVGNDVLLIEGGPPHTASGGAHPCCFPPGRIEGIALASQPGALTS
jgi:hypothetical protein